jgi:hypothetical protein
MTANQYLWDRITGRDPNIRAAEADRERIAERLRKGHTEGRLDMDEFQQRLEHCYQARTLGELDELVSDLPRQDVQPERRALRAMPAWRLAPLAPILLALIVVSAATGHHVFWLWIPLVFLVWRMSWWRRPWAGTRRGWDS